VSKLIASPRPSLYFTSFSTDITIAILRLTASISRKTNINVIVDGYRPFSQPR
jgi:hypothetical protein